ncbi:MAG: hypothetical protein EPO51_20775 [Phenylobacterium sp.]|uniref:hypothetical protein n=1 Tax=Phenylobacterium sp. TaxID=1871053 RepID=UPI00121E85A8|nr:hypothetical protein [Phenylobacterium sp.]TAJ69958.1 MAG: hypothetical protein EPO51_20775 [Phenylobacterium sp.]
MLGHDLSDIFGEATNSADGFIVVDFLIGATTGAEPSPDLARTVGEYAKALHGLCERHGSDASAFAALTARYEVDRVYGRQFTVTVEDRSGRISVDRYLGVPGRKLPAHRR